MVRELERQKERSARTAGKPTDQFVLCADWEPRLNETRRHMYTRTRTQRHISSRCNDIDMQRHGRSLGWGGGGSG